MQRVRVSRIKARLNVKRHEVQRNEKADYGRLALGRPLIAY